MRVDKLASFGRGRGMAFARQDCRCVSTHRVEQASPVPISRASAAQYWVAMATWFEPRSESFRVLNQYPHGSATTRPAPTCTTRRASRPIFRRALPRCTGSGFRIRRAPVFSASLRSACRTGLHGCNMLHRDPAWPPDEPAIASTARFGHLPPISRRVAEGGVHSAVAIYGFLCELHPRARIRS
jgi:hypothetical protein